jgi:hypothetical protein
MIREVTELWCVRQDTRITTPMPRTSSFPSYGLRESLAGRGTYALAGLSGDNGKKTAPAIGDRLFFSRIDIHICDPFNWPSCTIDVRGKEQFTLVTHSTLHLTCP